jgi:hypothetical protein
MSSTAAEAESLSHAAPPPARGGNEHQSRRRVATTPRRIASDAPHFEGRIRLPHRRSETARLLSLLANPDGLLNVRVAVPYGLSLIAGRPIGSCCPECGASCDARGDGGSPTSAVVSSTVVSTTTGPSGATAVPARSYSGVNAPMKPTCMKPACVKSARATTGTCIRFSR